MTAPTAASGERKRFTHAAPCPACGGYDAMQRGKGIRCSGYWLGERGWYCERVESNTRHPSEGLWFHRANGQAAPPRRSAKASGPTPWTFPDSEVSAIHRYTDVVEVVRFTKVARERGLPKVMPRHRRADGAWFCGLGGQPSEELPLYREAQALATLAAHDTLHIVEGEGDADAIVQAGGVATTNIGGAGKFRISHAATLAAPVESRSRIIIIADRDGEGKRHAIDVREKIVNAGVAPDRIQLRRAARGKDAADHIGHGLSLNAFEPLEEEPATEAPPTPSSGGEINAEDEEVLASLARLSAVEYDRRREAAAEELHIRLATLDEQVAKRRPAPPPPVASGGEALRFDPIEPWAEAVEGAALLGNLVELIKRFVVLPKHGATAGALWILHAHAHTAASVSPILAVLSPILRCGKTKLLTVIGRLVPKPLPASNITAAALFRGVEAFEPTLLVDEADTFLGKGDELRGILNSGHTRETAYVIRTVGDEHEPRTFRTWAPKAVALIGSLPATLADRSITVSMRRRRSDETVERLRGDRDAGFTEARRRCARWVVDHLADLRAADPVLPEGLHDRAADNWGPLLAIADAAGGPWPDLARQAALGLSLEDEEAEGFGLRLLADIRAVFDSKGERITTEQLLLTLKAIPEAPWSEYGKSEKPITARQLGQLLGPFGIRSGNVRIDDGSQRKGYQRVDFEDAWARYSLSIPPDPPSPIRPTVPTEENQGVAANSIRPKGEVGTDGKAGKTQQNQAWDGGTDAEPESGQEEDIGPDREGDDALLDLF